MIQYIVVAVAVSGVLISADYGVFGNQKVSVCRLYIQSRWVFSDLRIWHISAMRGTWKIAMEIGNMSLNSQDTWNQRRATSHNQSLHIS